jgi:dCTP diphosphatase
MSPSDAATTLDEVRRWIRDFTEARDWGQFHNPKDLGVALVIEVGELLEHVRYRTDEQIAQKLADPETHRAFAHELADCLWLIVRLADVCGVDLASSLQEKLELADRKYPADVVRGRPDKYTAYLKPTASSSDPVSSPGGSGPAPSVP